MALRILPRLRNASFAAVSASFKKNRRNRVREKLPALRRHSWERPPSLEVWDVCSGNPGTMKRLTSLERTAWASSFGRYAPGSESEACLFRVSSFHPNLNRSMVEQASWCSPTNAKESWSHARSRPRNSQFRNAKRYRALRQT